MKTGTCYRVDHLLAQSFKLEKDLTISAENADEFKDVLTGLERLKG